MHPELTTTVYIIIAVVFAAFMIGLIVYTRRMNINKSHHGRKGTTSPQRRKKGSSSPPVKMRAAPALPSSDRKLLFRRCGRARIAPITTELTAPKRMTMATATMPTPTTTAAARSTGTRTIEVHIKRQSNPGLSRPHREVRDPLSPGHEHHLRPGRDRRFPLSPQTEPRPPPSPTTPTALRRSAAPAPCSSTAKPAWPAPRL